MDSRIITLLIFITGILSPLYSQTKDYLLTKLDENVQKRSYYISLKENTIDSLKKISRTVLNNYQHYEINNSIYEEYSTFRFDSAMYYVNQNMKIAQRLNYAPYMNLVKMHESILLATTGMYHESIDIFNTIDLKDMDDKLLVEYYRIAEWIYYASAEYSGENNRYKEHYQLKEKEYREKLLSLLTPGSMEYDYYLGKKYIYEGNLVEAKKILALVFTKMDVKTRIYAQTSFYLAEIYRLEKNWDMYQTFLTLAAISDQVCPLKENQAMQDLALYLYSTNPNEIDRAYKYIQCSMEDAQFYKNRLRMVQIAQKLPVIVQAYQAKSDREKRSTEIMLLGITGLSVLTILALFYIWHQMKLVKRSRGKIMSINSDLERLNNELTKANSIKEEYIGLFLDLSSSYLDKIDSYKETVKRKIKANQIDDLYNRVNSNKLMEKELREFFHKFDISFLKLFPDFIDGVNALLNNENQLKPKKDALLNTELRIFALIRLGINDSSKIASFLRYSPQTIYNYRAKVKSNAKNIRSEFEKEILKIGTIRTIKR